MTHSRHVDIFLLCFISSILVPSHLFEWKSMAVYSRHDAFILGNLTVAMFDLEGISSMRCGRFCLEESCCKGFMYSRTTKRCVGVHFEDFDYTSNFQLSFSDSEGLIPYQKGCETGWLEFKGHCYHKGQSMARWSEAKAECQKKCSYLVEVESTEEAEWISSTFLEDDSCASFIFSNCIAWTGLNDLDIEGSYIWAHSNASLTFTNWYPDEPSLATPAEALTRD